MKLNLPGVYEVETFISLRRLENKLLWEDENYMDEYETELNELYQRSKKLRINNARKLFVLRK